jgi:ribosomal protein S18 acetylase RimI-like enzyme
MDEEREDVTIRALTMSDCTRLVRMDHAISGRNRQSWYEGKLRRALEEADVRVSLGAEVDGVLVGALMGSVHYGEFGQPEPVAILDTALVDPRYARRGIATAMLESLVRNLSALRIERLRTEVSWDEFDLLGFFARAGFKPVPRLVLELPIG